MYPLKTNVSGTTALNAYLELYNYDWFKDVYEKEAENVKEKQEQTGF